MWRRRTCLLLTVVVLALIAGPLATRAAVGGHSQVATSATKQKADDGEPPETEVYQSEYFGFVITYDANEWELEGDSSANGEDYVTFSNGSSFLTLDATAGYHGNPVACRDDWARTLRRLDGVTNFRIMNDDDGTPIAGEEDDSAFGAYSYTSEDGEEVFDLECRVLVEDEATLVIILETFQEDYAEQLRATEDFLDGLDVSDVAVPDLDEIEATTGDESDDREAVDPNASGVDLIVLVDNFEHPERSLLSTTTPDPNLVRYAYENGEFIIQTLQDDAGAWQAGLPNVYQEVSLAVNARFVGETTGRYVKVACRSTITGDGVNEYSLILDASDGYVSLDSWEDNERVNLFEDALPDVVKLGEETNRIQLDCFGDQITATINGTQVASVTNDSHQKGSVYLAAGTYADTDGTVEVHFDRLLVQIPESERPPELDRDKT